jgi:hypothetical protein
VPTIGNRPVEKCYSQANAKKGEGFLINNRKLTGKILMNSGVFSCLSTNSGDNVVIKLGQGVNTWKYLRLPLALNILKNCFITCESKHDMYREAA